MKRRIEVSRAIAITAVVLGIMVLALGAIFLTGYLSGGNPG